jgi:hypothetical protein
MKTGSGGMAPCILKLQSGWRRLNKAKPSLNAGCFLCLLVDPEAGGNMFLRNVDKLLPDYTVDISQSV